MIISEKWTLKCFLVFFFYYRLLPAVPLNLDSQVQILSPSPDGDINIIIDAYNYSLKSSKIQKKNQLHVGSDHSHTDLLDP